MIPSLRRLGRREEFQHDNDPKQTRQSIFVLRNEGYSMREIAKKLKISYNAVYYSLHRTAQIGSNQNRKRSGRPSPQLAASLNSTVSTSTTLNSLNVNSGEATLGCCPSRQSSSVQCLCYFAHLNLFFLLANLRMHALNSSLLPLAC